jgi:threonine synthase
MQTVHEGRPLWVRYDLDAVSRSVTWGDIASRPATMWRYRELLPVERDEDIISLGETMTPLIRCERLGAHLGLNNLLIKDESRLPTGSFKSRGMAMAVTMAKALGVKRVAAPTAGNAGGALAAYAARAGLECFIFMPRDTPIVNQLECVLHGAKSFLVDGLITDCGRIVAEGRERMGWLDMSTLKEPYRLEGKKTMGLELAEQLGWSLPDLILYPTGGGTGLVGMWKAFEELGAIGWLKNSPSLSGRGRGSGAHSPNAGSVATTAHPAPSEGGKVALPRMFACQSTGCAPIVRAFEKGERFAEQFENAQTIASGLRVPRAVGDFMILDAVRASGGCAMAAEESRIVEWMRLACELEGIALCPEAAVCIGVAEEATRRGLIPRDEQVVLFNTGAVQKYVEAMKVELPAIDHRRIDWSLILHA